MEPEGQVRTRFVAVLVTAIFLVALTILISLPLLISLGTGLQALDRAVAIYFQCENDDTPLPTSEQVDEMISCLYIINIKSVHGCPLECGKCLHSDLRYDLREWSLE